MRRIALLLALSSACSVSLVTPDDAVIVCDEDADCPLGRCDVALQRCVGAGSGTPLRFTSAIATSSVRVDAVFNQPLAPRSVVGAAQVTIVPALAVTGLALDETNQRLSVTTEQQAFDVVYTLTVTGFLASAGDPLEETARSQSFTSFLGLADRNPPAIIRPADGSRVRGGDVDFAWQAIGGATSYTLEVFRRGEAAPLALVEVPATTTTISIALPLEGTYDWRVRADTTTAGVYNNAAFDALVDAVYVSCSEPECPPRLGNGSRRAPVQRINEGLVLARQLGIGSVRVAARADGGTYDEILVLADTPVTIDGGFDAAFTPGAGRAEIAAVGTVIVARPASGPLRIANVLLSALSAPNLEVVSVEGATDITFDDVVILAEPTIDTSVGINCDGRPGIADVHLADVTMLLSTSASVGVEPSESMVGIRGRDARLDVRDSFLSVGLEPAGGGGPNQIRGIELLGNGTFAATRLTVGVGYAVAVSTAYFDDRSARPSGAPAYDLIEASRFFVPVSNSAIIAVYITHLRRIVVRNSVVVAGGAPAVDAVRILGGLEDGSPGDGPNFIHDLIQVTNDRPSNAIASNVKGFMVANSIITTDACTNVACGSTTNRCLFVNGDVGPAALVGTALACEAPYAGFGLGSPDFSQPSPSCADGQGRVIRCTGTTLVTPPLGAYFTDGDGADASIGTAADNDYHLLVGAPASLRTGGVNLAGNVCGYADQSLPCNAGTTDADGVTRSNPFSMGPYEY
ncbi:MAG: hypothetical protein ACAI38_25515 [Myxococcota bacterium]